MKKRIVICADGTWNRPEKDLDKDVATNVLRMARSIKPVGRDRMPQQVFYDWGIGSYYAAVIGGATGKGIDKNIMDDYRYIVQNYAPGDELYLFGFSRGAYTIRSLCGLINNCGILKRPHARLIQAAFDHYKHRGKHYRPSGQKSVKFRRDYSHVSRRIKFVGVWDTVGALGIPFSFFGLLEPRDEFHDTEIGPNIQIARHALAIDEKRADFEPTVWQPQGGMDLMQVWFAGAHSDVGGGYQPDRKGLLSSDHALEWMMKESGAADLTLEPHLGQGLNPRPTARLHESRRHIFRSKPRQYRTIAHNKGKVLIHSSVKQRWDKDSKYRPKNLVEYLNRHGWPNDLVP